MKLTRSGTMYNQRDLVLMPMPFSDLSSKQNRPVIVLSNDLYNQKSQDILVVAATAVLKEEPYSLELENNSLENGKLPLPSRIKCDKIYLLQSKIVVKKFGRIKKEKFEEIKNQIIKLISEKH